MFSCLLEVKAGAIVGNCVQLQGVTTAHAAAQFGHHRLLEVLSFEGSAVRVQQCGWKGEIFGDMSDMY